MEAPSATAASVSPPFPKATLSQALAAPIHRKARILTRDPLREADDSMELQAEDDVRRSVFLMIIKKKNVIVEDFKGGRDKASV